MATAETVVVPVLPSVPDEMATARFLSRMARIKSLRKGRLGLHVIANRVSAGSRAMVGLIEFAENRDLIFTAILSERALW